MKNAKIPKAENKMNFRYVAAEYVLIMLFSAAIWLDCIKNSLILLKKIALLLKYNAHLKYICYYRRVEQKNNDIAPQVFMFTAVTAYLQ